jgi:hypothetical protein
MLRRRYYDKVLSQRYLKTFPGLKECMVKMGKSYGFYFALAVIIA